VKAAVAAYRSQEQGASDEAFERAMTRAQKTLGKFTTTVGEEESTTRSYRLARNRYLTVTVFYTDESMASTRTQDSMQIALAVSKGPLKDARSSRSSTTAEMTYNDGADKLRIGQSLLVDGREYQIVVECTCHQAKKE